MRRVSKGWLIAAGMVAVVVALGSAVVGHFQLDFSEYWIASRLFGGGANPYDVAAMGWWQHAMGSTESRALMMINPPWTLAALGWLGLMPYASAQAAWFAVLLAASLGASLLLWRFYGGSWRSAWAAVVVALLFYPTLDCLVIGQITPLLLLLATGYLVLQEKRHDLAAGACLLGMCIKPHLFVVFGLAVLLQTLRTRRYKVLVGAAAALGFCALAVEVARPSVWAEYLAFVRSGYVNSYLPALGGTMLRMAFGPRRLWLQFVPSACGAVWVCWYHLRHRRGWEWREQAPLVMMASVVTSSYGWSFDEVLLLVSLVPAVMAMKRARAWWGPGLLLAAGNALLFVQSVLHGQERWKGGTAVLLSAGCWWALRVQRGAAGSLTGERSGEDGNTVSADPGRQLPDEIAVGTAATKL